VVLLNTGDDSFEGIELETVLAQRHVTHTTIAGLLSEMCVSATVRSAITRGIVVGLVRDTNGTYNLEDIPPSIVSRVAEDALGDRVELINAASVAFNRPVA